MKKTVLTLLLLVAAINLLPAQKENRKSIFGVNAGVAIPFAEFADRTMEGYSGFAAAGMNIDVDLLRYIGRYFGFTSNIGYASIFFNEKEYRTEYDRILSGYGQNSVTAGNYQVLKGLLGYTFRIPVTEQAEVLLFCQAGVALSLHPDLLVTNTELGVINSVSRNSDWHPVSNTGVKINYWMNDKYGISLNYSLNATRPAFSDQTGIRGTFVLPIRYMTVNAGLVMNL